VLDDPFQHITERNPSRRSFGAFGAIHWHDEIVLRSQMHRERMSRLVELAIIDTNGSRLNDQIHLMRHAPYAQHRIGALTLEQCHNTASATCHRVLPIRGDGNQFVIPGAAQNVHHGFDHRHVVDRGVALKGRHQHYMYVHQHATEAHANALIHQRRPLMLYESPAREKALTEIFQSTFETNCNAAANRTRTYCPTM
jgi:hypothetical protein